jgi:hypothetical protein
MHQNQEKVQSATAISLVNRSETQGSIIVEDTVPWTMDCRAARSDSVIMGSKLRGGEAPTEPHSGPQDSNLENRAKLHVVKQKATSDRLVSLTSKNNIQVWNRALSASLISGHKTIGKPFNPLNLDMPC